MEQYESVNPNVSGETTLGVLPSVKEKAKVQDDVEGVKGDG